MVQISTNDLKNGTVLDLDGQLWSVIWFQHHKPGKGNTVVRTKLKHVLSGKVVDRTFNSDTKVDTATVDRREMQYLYHDGESYVFMDTSTYDQLNLTEATVGDANGKRPGMLDLVGRAKYDAWERLKGNTADQAMEQYIAVVQKMLDR